jgi:hypothetical protein
MIDKQLTLGWFRLVEVYGSRGVLLFPITHFHMS